jgi:tRNA dimethylallyltransferase
MKIHTRQYVKSQLAWINHKLIPQCQLLNPKTKIYILDATDLKKWSEKVLNPAISISRGTNLYSLKLLMIIAFLAGETLPPTSSIFAQADELLNPVRHTSPPEDWKHWPCDVCEENGESYVVVGGELEWNAHLKSRRHRTRERGIKKREDWEVYKASKKRQEESGNLDYGTGINTKEN